MNRRSNKLTFRFTSFTRSSFSTIIIKSGKPSVNRTTRSRDNCSTSAVDVDCDVVLAMLLERGKARCFPLAFSLSGMTDIYS